MDTIVSDNDDRSLELAAEIKIMPMSLSALSTLKH